MEDVRKMYQNMFVLSIKVKKVTKNLQFLKVLGSRGLPREPWEAQEGSKEAPKELQNPTKKASKNEPQIYQILDQFWGHFGVHFGA